MRNWGQAVVGVVLLVLGAACLVGGVVVGVVVPADGWTDEPTMMDQHLAVALATFGTGIFVSGIVLICTAILVFVARENRKQAQVDMSERDARGD